MQGVLYEEGSLGVFLLVTLAMGGWAGWMAARAVARGWRPYWQCVPALLAVAAAVRASAGLERLLLDWGGGLVWIAGPATPAAHAAVMAATRAEHGSFTLFRAPEPLRAAVAVLPEEPPALAAITRRVKAVLDPKGVLNPGRIWAGL